MYEDELRRNARDAIVNPGDGEAAARLETIKRRAGIPLTPAEFMGYIERSLDERVERGDINHATEPRITDIEPDRTECGFYKEVFVIHDPTRGNSECYIVDFSVIRRYQDELDGPDDILDITWGPVEGHVKIDYNYFKDSRYKEPIPEVNIETDLGRVTAVSIEESALQDLDGFEKRLYVGQPIKEAVDVLVELLVYAQRKLLE